MTQSYRGMGGNRTNLRKRLEAGLQLYTSPSRRHKLGAPGLASET